MSVLPISKNTPPGATRRSDASTNSPANESNTTSNPRPPVAARNLSSNSRLRESDMWSSSKPMARKVSHLPLLAVANTSNPRCRASCTAAMPTHLHTLGRTDYRCARRRGRGHEFIIAAGSDNSGQPESTPGAVPSSPRKEMLGSGSAPAGAKGTRDNEISEPTMETLNGVGREAGEMLGAAGGHRIDRPQTQPARLQPSTRLAAKSHACQRIPVYFPVCFQSLIRPTAKS